ncbi:MAG TPA: tetratricopeptide repeat protein [Candidatus Limnocylindria bacterium]|nr:tetratricopeptide repeat protein [Candidatus Limnocylindria bacterium]
MTRALGILVLLAAAAVTAHAADTRGLEQRANAFYDRLARGDTAAARSAFPALERDLARAIETRQERMDAQREAVVERDGDLEALYESPSWRDDEVAVLVLGYHLAWVRYQGAQLTEDAARKKALLRQAADGFEQYSAMQEIPEIYAESLYGRGLALMDLGQYRDAIADLEAAAKLSRTATKAKAALAEARRRAAGGKPVVPPDPAEELARLRARMEAAATAPDSAAETTELARGLAARGGDWPSRVQAVLRDLPPSSYTLFLQGQLAIDARRCSELPALVAAGAELRDRGRGRWRPELLFLEAACVLNDGRQAEAARLFDALASEFPASPRAEDAAYYRCRALDVARHGDEAAARQYEPALRAYLERFGKTARAREIRFLLAELLRERDDCAAATALYDEAAAGEFTARARLGVIECRVAALGPEAAAERTAVLADLRRFVTDPPAHADERTLAKASLLGALVAVRQKPPDDAAVLAFLADYERRFPKEAEWHDTARRVRLEARLRAGQYAEARQDVDALLAETADPTTRKLLVRIGKDLMRRKTGDPAESAALARKIWGALAADGSDPQDLATLAELELQAGNAAEARRLFEQVLAIRPDSAQAQRGAARAAAALGDRDAAMARWREVVEHSTPGGTSWYEARLAQFELLAESGHVREACDLARRAAGQSKTTGGDVLARQLAERAASVCR